MPSGFRLVLAAGLPSFLLLLGGLGLLCIVVGACLVATRDSICCRSLDIRPDREPVSVIERIRAVFIGLIEDLFLWTLEKLR
ncbi:MAG: hypothetical protein [Cressdnaviricota sp.]|nr:MAG: hypothetical protein [Cressdnaviricota sp.]